MVSFFKSGCLVLLYFQYFISLPYFGHRRVWLWTFQIIYTYLEPFLEKYCLISNTRFLFLWPCTSIYFLVTYPVVYIHVCPVSLQSLADNALLGILIGVGLAFPILSLSTMNVLIGFLATLSICCTTVCVIGVIPLAGWKLGVSSDPLK